MNDLKLIAGDFFDLDLPKEDRYLFKYFPTGVQRQFLRYFYTFGEYTRFVEHTGFSCTKRWLRRLKRRYKKVTNSYNLAKSVGDSATIAQIKMGKFKAGK